MQNGKTKELIALAVAVTTRCDSCIAAHAKAAREAGVTEAELADALGTAIALNAGAAYSYAFRTLEAFQQFEPSSSRAWQTRHQVMAPFSRRGVRSVLSWSLTTTCLRVST
jgi:AhpD family alkylhydroperoxidase